MRWRLDPRVLSAAGLAERVSGAQAPAGGGARRAGGRRRRTSRTQGPRAQRPMHCDGGLELSLMMILLLVLLVLLLAEAG